MNSDLTLKQRLFCKLYTGNKEFFGNGVRAYAHAYGLNLTLKRDYGTAKTNAHRLLTNADISAYITQLLDLAGLNDQYIDKQLYFLVTQNVDLSAKIAAIREYNKTRGRIIHRTDLTTQGDQITGGIVIFKPERYPDTELRYACVSTVR